MADEFVFDACAVKRFSISLADSIVLAEAKVRKNSLVTCDHHEFDPIEKIMSCLFFG